MGGVGAGKGMGAAGLRRGGMSLAELDEVAVAVEAEGAAAEGGDADGRPGGLVEEVDLGAADGGEAGEAVEDLGAEVCLDRVVLLGGGEGEGDAEAWGDAGDAGAGGGGVFADGEGVEEAEVDNVAGQGRVVAVAEGGLNFQGFGGVSGVSGGIHCGSLRFGRDDTVYFAGSAEGRSGRWP